MNITAVLLFDLILENEHRVYALIHLHVDASDAGAAATKIHQPGSLEDNGENRLATALSALVKSGFHTNPLNAAAESPLHHPPSNCSSYVGNGGDHSGIPPKIPVGPSIAGRSSSLSCVGRGAKLKFNNARMPSSVAARE